MDQMVLLTRRVYRLEQELAALKGAPLTDFDETFEPAAAVGGKAMQSSPDIVPAARPQTDVDAFETEVAATWFARIGAVALIIGAAFAFKYGVDRGYIGPGLRVATGVVVGFALLFVSEWAMRKTWDVFAQAIAATGTGLLFLTVWASYHLYAFINAGTTFPLLIVVTLLMAGLAVRHNSVALAILATVGGFIDPLLVGGAHHPLALYGYVLVLDLGVVGLSTARRWTAPPFIAFAGSWIIYATGVEHASDPTAFWYATAFFFIFATPAFARVARNRDEDMAGATLFLASGVAYLAAGLSVLDRHNANLQVPFAAALGLVCLMVGAYSWLDQRNRDAGAASFVFGMGSIAVAGALQFHGDALSVAAAVLAVVYVWMGSKLRLTGASWVGVVLLGCAVLATVFGLYQLGADYRPDRLIVSAQSGAMVSQIFALYVVGLLVRKDEDPNLRAFGVPGIVAANVVTVIWMSFEAYARQRGLTGNRPSSAFPFTLSAIWALYAALLLVIGFVFRTRGARLMSLALFGATIVKMALVDLWTVPTGYRVLGFLGLGVLLLTASLSYQRFRVLIVGDESAADQTT